MGAVCRWAGPSRLDGKTAHRAFEFEEAPNGMISNVGLPSEALLTHAITTMRLVLVFGVNFPYASYLPSEDFPISWGFPLFKDLAAFNAVRTWVRAG